MATKKRMAYKNKGRRSPRHAFLFQLKGHKPGKAWATVKPAKTKVEFDLTEADVLKAIDDRGFGDAQNCVGALCARRNSDSFPHAVSGHFDWLYRRIYVADRNDALGLPRSCVAYSHNDNIARLFDTQEGVKKLLRIVRESGPIRIALYPPVYREREPGRPKGKGDAPPRRKAGKMGHKLRLTTWKAGWDKDDIEHHNSILEEKG